MILTAQDIRSQQFHVRFRGFDVEEVDDFLEKIAAAFQEVSEENQKLKGRLESMESDLSSYQNQQKSFQNAIIAAQNVADGMKEKSREEAEAIVAEATEEARLRREEATYEIAELKKKISDLKSLREQAREELRGQLQAYLRMLDTEPADPARAAEHFSSPPPREEPPRVAYSATPRSRAAAAPEPGPRQAATMPFASDGEDEEVDLSDLYVKIDIPDIDAESRAMEPEDDLDPAEIALPSSISSGKNMLAMDEDEEPEPALPDLDGDMVFNLEDPLEGDEEPAVSFADNLKDATKKTNRFNPDESPL